MDDLTIPVYQTQRTKRNKEQKGTKEQKNEKEQKNQNRQEQRGRLAPLSTHKRSLYSKYSQILSLYRFFSL